MNSLKHKIPTSKLKTFFSFWKSGLKVFVTLTVCLLLSFQAFANSDNNFDLEVICTPYDATCDENNGAVTTTVSGGVAPYNYFWSNGSTSTAIVNLAAGNYSVTVIDAIGNTATCMTTVVGFPGITITSVIVVEANCDSTNGFAFVNVAEDPDGILYDYDWSSNVGGSNNNQAFDLLADTYSVTITDPAQPGECSFVETFSVGNVDGPETTLNTTASVCGQDNGSAIFDNLDYDYSWSPSLGTPNAEGNIRTDLPAGTYFVTITDPLDPTGCYNIKTVVIDEILSITVDYTINNSPDCGVANGSVTINASGGSGNYSYSWGAATMNNLAAGVYEVTVTDTNTGCTGSVIFTLLDSGGGTNVVIDDIVIACAGDMDGTVVYTVTPDPGASADTIIQDANGNEYINGTLSPGAYCVVIKDANGCYSGSDCFEIEAPTQIDADLAIVDETCELDVIVPGSITIEITGGAGGYSYSWSHDPNIQGPIANNLTEGTYSVTITDANGCTGVADNLIVDYIDNCEDDPPCELIIESVVVVEASCGNSDGSAIVNAAGGPGGTTYFYEWPSNVFAADNAAFNLSAGTYSVTITDDLGACPPFVETFTVGNIDGPESDYQIEPDTCGLQNTGSVTFDSIHFNYVWNPNLGDSISNYERTNLPAGDYFITITDPNNPGCEDVLTIVVEDVNLLDITPQVNSAPDCDSDNGSVTINVSGGIGPYTIDWGASIGIGQTFNNLEPGNYEVTVTDDATGCVGVAPFSLSVGGADVTIDSITGVDCPGDFMGMVHYSINPVIPNATIQIVNLSGVEFTNGFLESGTYFINVFDNNTCLQAAETFTIDAPTQIDVDVSIYPEDCDSFGFISLAVTGGAGGYTYSWDPPILSGSTVEDLVAGTYSVTVSDANGCSVGAGQLIVGDSCTTPPPPPPCFITSVVVIEASCGNNDGFAIVNVAGDPNGDTFNYEWSSNVGSSTNNQAFGLSADTYSVTITDTLNTGCFLIETFTVGNIDGPESDYEVMPSSCTVSDGKVTFDSTNYEYSWFPDIGVDQGHIRDSLPAGDYFVTITDPMDTTCIDVITVVVEAEGTLNVSPFSINSTDCDSNDGSAEINTLNLNGSGNYAIIWESLGIEIGTGPMINALSVGNYTITVTDNNTGCVGVSTFSILGGTPSGDTITIDSISTLLCAGDENGMVYFNAPSSLDSVEIVNQYGVVYQNGTLGAGSYCINGYDSTGCLIDSECFEIEAPTQIDIDISIYPVECDSFGFIALAITGGTPPYQILLDGGPIPPGLTIEDLDPGTYILTVSDANGCNVGAVALFVGDNCPTTCELIVDGKFSKNASCGLADGWASIIMDNTSGVSYTYSWSPPIVSTGPIATGLAAGIYSVTVADASNPDSCFIVETFVIENIGGPDPGYEVTSDTCGQNTGTITFDNPTYTYEWEPNVSTGPTATDLPAGTYIVTITDITNCVSIKIIEVEEIPSITIDSINIVQPECNVENGEVTVTASGGSGNYSYSLNPNVGTQNGNSWTDLPVGLYTVTVTDTTNDCSIDTIFTLSPVNINIEIDSISTLLCPGDENGTVYYTVTSSDPTTEEIVDLFGNVYDNGTLGPGFYCIIASDATGCEAIECFTIEAPTQINAVVEITDETCDGLGSIALEVEGGAGGYSIGWSPSVGTLGGSYIITGLPSDIYSVTVTDGNGCSISGDIPIGGDSICCDPPIIDGLLTVNATCGNADGWAFINIDGGPVGFTYTWSPPIISTGPIATGLAAGIYSVTVTYENNPECPPLVETFAIENIGGPDVVCEVNPDTCGLNTGTITCSGDPAYTYQWDPLVSTGPTATNLPAGTYILTVTDTITNCVSIEIIEVEEISSLTIDTMIISYPECDTANGAVAILVSGGSGNYTYNWSPNQGTPNVGGDTRTDLPPGVYTVVVTDDATGCTGSIIFSLPGDGGMVDITIDSIPELLCAGDENGTVVYTINPQIPDSLVQIVGLLGNVYQNGSLGPGFYCIIAYDSTGCLQASACFEIEVPTQINVVVDIVDVKCDSLGSIALEVEGGAGGYNIDWSPSVGTLGGSYIITELPADIYSVTVTDANGCFISGELEVEADTNNVNILVEYDSIVCIGSDLMISVTNLNPGDSLVFDWGPDSLIVSGGTTSSPTINTDTAGVYTIFYDISNQYGCITSDTFQITVAVDSINLMILEMDSIYCDDNDLPSSITADCDNCDVNMIEWFQDPGSIIGTGSTYLVNSVSGTYYAQFIDTVTGCSGIDEVTLSLDTFPDLPLGSQTICYGDTGLIVGPEANEFDPILIIDWEWEGENIIYTDNPNEIYVNPAQEATYALIITTENGCTATYDYEIVEVTNIGEVTATADTSQICIYESVQLDVVGQLPGSTYTYQWSNGESLDNSTIQNPLGSPLETTTYDVTATADGCEVVSSVSVSVVHPACEEPYVFFPNAFTPNGDGHNDELCLRGSDVTDVHFIIYNRWGEKMFESNSQGECWDGTFAGKELGADVYGYYLQVRCGNGEEFIKKGNVTILK